MGERTALTSPPSRANWLDAPFNRRAFQEVDRIIPVVPIGRGAGPVRALGVAHDSGGIDRIGFETAAGRSTVAEFIERSCTDGLLVMRGETVVAERYLNGLTPATRHVLMSVSKSLAGMLTGRLAGRGAIDLDRRVEEFVPELTGAAHGDATVRQLLDMTASLRFNQDYVDPRSDVQTEDRATGWRPRLPGDPPDTKRFLATLAGDGPHGERFQYCSATTDVLAWVLERATGTPYAELLGGELWSRIGAEHDAYVTVDAGGFPYACAGVNATLRDVARFGRLVLDGGSWDGEDVLPGAWIEETRRGRGSAVATGAEFPALVATHPAAVYHNQWWTTRGPRGAFFGVGIFGQYLWLDPEADVVIAKLSSLPVPVAPENTDDHVAALGALAAAVAA